MSTDSRQQTSKRPSVKAASHARGAQPVRRSVSGSGAGKAKPSAKQGMARPSSQGGKPSGARNVRAKSGETRGGGLAGAQGDSRRQGAARLGKSASSSGSRNRTNGTPKRKAGLGRRIVASKPVLITLALVAVVVLVGIADTAANWGKAYGNISVMGIDVGGRTADEMRQTLKMTFGPRVSHAQVTVYASDEARAQAGDELAGEQRRATAEQLSFEDASSAIGEWTTDALSLKAQVDYEAAIAEALAFGRGSDGIIDRLSLIVGAHDIDLNVKIDDGALEGLLHEVDRAIGDERVDATVEVEYGEAYAVEGHDGMMVDRERFKERVSDALIREDVPNWFVAQASFAPSRISMEQATSMADAVNQALESGVSFIYKSTRWTPKPAELGEWVAVDTVQDAGGGYRLAASIDASEALPAVVKGAGASITSDDMTVTFEDDGGEIVVRTDGTGNIPEVSSAVEKLDEMLFGKMGYAWHETSAPGSIVIEESDRPEVLSLEQAYDLGVITVIGEYTTEFSNLEGTENRNHNIKLAADILDNGIIEADGGTWTFNERSGDTNEEAGFWSAGSIVDGEFVDSIGGGICQVATTIFNAVYEAGLEVVERHNHSLYIASYPTGRDAAVNYPDVEFEWRNDLPSDILLRLDYTDETVTARLFSIYTGYHVTTETGQWEDGKKYGTRFELDESLGEGAYYRKTIGEDGSSITIVRTVYDEDDKVVKADSFGSLYDAKDEVYVIGPGVDTSKLERKVGEDGSL